MVGAGGRVILPVTSIFQAEITAAIFIAAIILEDCKIRCADGNLDSANSETVNPP